MQAAATYLYACLLQLGSVRWHKSELTGKMVGNPSISEVVSTYMLSLRRRKVRLSLQNSHVFPFIISWELGSKGGGPYKCILEKLTNVAVNLSHFPTNLLIKVLSL